MQWSPDYFTELSLSFINFDIISFEGFFYSRGAWVLGVCDPLTRYYGQMLYNNPTLWMGPQITNDHGFNYDDQNRISNVSVSLSSMDAVDSSALYTITVSPNGVISYTTTVDPPVPLPVNASKVLGINYLANGTYIVRFANGTTRSFIYNRATVTAKTLPTINPDLVWAIGSGKPAP